MNIISNNQMARHLLTLVFAVLMAFSAAYAEKVATPRGDAVSGTGSSNCARFTPQEVICDTEGATIRYEVYEWGGATSPEVTEESPVFPEDGCVFKDCTPGKTYGLRVRAFKEGMEPSDQKSGWHCLIYLEAVTLADFINLDPTSVNGVGNSKFPITYTGTATVTWVKKGTGYFALENTWIYMQDETAAICVHWYGGDLVPGDQVTNLVLCRQEKEGNYGEWFTLHKTTDTNFKNAVLPLKTGHVDKVEPRPVAGDKVCEAPANYLVKVCDLEPYRQSGSILNVKYNGWALSNTKLRLKYFDSSIERNLKLDVPYDMVGLVEFQKSGSSTFPYLDYISSEEHTLRPYLYPTTTAFKTFKAARNQPIYIISYDADARIYYTTDGTEPTEESTLYTGVFTVPDKEEYTVRYKAFKDGLLPTEGESLKFQVGNHVLVNFDFEAPEKLTPALPKYEGEDIELDGAITLIGHAGDDVTVKVTFTPAEGTKLKITQCKEKTSVLQLPEGTKVHIESSHEFVRMDYKNSRSKSYRDGLVKVEGSCPLGGPDSYGWENSFPGVNPMYYEADFTAQSVKYYGSPEFQALMIGVDPSHPVPVTGISFAETAFNMEKGSTLALTPALTPEIAPASAVAWESSDTAVAAVDEKGVVTAVANGEATITAKSVADESVRTEVSVTVTTSATGLTLGQETLALKKGENVTLTATVAPEDASDKAVVWSSSDEAVATVDAQGVVTALKTGTATLTASHASGLSATCEVTVTTPAESITIDKETLALRKGETAALVVTVGPEDADDKAVAWSSSDETVATVDAEGTVTAVKTGKATVTAADVEGHTAACEVTVITPATGVTLDLEEVTVAKGRTVTLTATVEPEDADDKVVIWSVADETVATVSQTGVVTGVKSGETAVIATDVNGNAATCHVKVFTPATGITLDPIETTVVEGNTCVIAATVLPADADDKTVEWSSSDETVATVSAQGEVAGVMPGTANITASAAASDDVKAVCVVTVTKDTGIVAVGVDGTVSLRGRTLRVDGLEGRTLTLWSASGAAVWSVVSDGDVKVELGVPAGIYLLRDDSGALTLKVFIP